MPLILKEPRAGASPFWRVRGSYLGIYVDRSTKATDRATARKVLKKIEDDIERGLFQKPVGPTFADAAFRYVRDGHEDRFIEKLRQHFGDMPLSAIDRKAIEDAAFALYPNAKPATRNRQVFTPMSAILRHADVDIRLKRPEGANGVQREFYLQPEQAEAIIIAATESRPEFGVFLTFLLYTGLRLSEALIVKCDDLEMKHATAFAGKTKNGEPRRVHLPPPLVAALANHPDGLERRGRLFRYAKCGRIYTWLDEAAEAAGVHIPDGVAFHAFRHTWGHWMRKYAGLDTTGLVATGAWKSHDAARRYEHAVASEEAQRADLLPVIRAKSV
jgi:integrase